MKVPILKCEKEIFDYDSRRFEHKNGKHIYKKKGNIGNRSKCNLFQDCWGKDDAGKS